MRIWGYLVRWCPVCRHVTFTRVGTRFAAAPPYAHTLRCYRAKHPRRVDRP